MNQQNIGEQTSKTTNFNKYRSLRCKNSQSNEVNFKSPTAQPKYSGTGIGQYLNFKPVNQRNFYGKFGETRNWRSNDRPIVRNFSYDGNILIFNISIFRI